MKEILFLILGMLFSTLSINAQTALDFDGTDDYVDCGNSLNLSTQWTAECWINPTTTSGGWHSFLSKDHHDNGDGFAMFISNGMVYLWKAGEAQTVSVAAPISASTWSHVAGVYDNGTWTLYVNGVDMGSLTATLTNASTPLIIGSRNSNSGTGSTVNFFNGKIDDVRIWNTARTQSEIQTEMNSCLTGGETSLVALYNFEYGTGSSSATDLTIFGNHGTLTNMDSATDWLSGMTCGLTSPIALDFDGADDYVDIGSNINLANQSFTIETWVKRNSVGTVAYIAGQGSTSSTNQALHVGFRSNNQFTLAFYGNDLTTTAIYTDTDWHHWAVTYDATSQEQRIYRDGVLAESGTSSGNFLGTGAFYIGTAAFTSSNLDGSLDNFRIWNTARTPNEIQGDMYRCLTGSETGLLALYDFEDGFGGSTLTDLTSNSNNGTLTNMDSGTDWVPGIVSCLTAPIALDFDKTNDYVDCGNAASLNLSNQWTAECWINPATTSGGWHSFLSKDHHGNGEGFAMFISNGMVYLWKAGEAPAVSVTAPISASTWSHVAGVYDNGIWTLYVNGVNMGSLTATFTNASSPLIIGARNSNNGSGPAHDNFSGQIDDVRIWNSARSQNEIQTNMTACITGSETSLLATYDFEDGQGSNVLTDLTANGNNGTLIDMDLQTDWIPGVQCSGTYLNINKLADHERISVYPNPSNGQFTLDIGDVTVQSVLVYNAQGKVVSNLSNTQSNVYNLNIPSGMYFMHLQLEKSRQIIKLIIR